MSTNKTAVVPACLSTVLFISIIFSCASFPAPSGEQDSLLVVVSRPGGAPAGAPVIDGQDGLVLTGPVELRLAVGKNEDGMQTAKLPAGIYRLSGLRSGSGAVPFSVNVPPGSVVLFPFALLSPDGRLFLSPIEPEDQRRAVEDLTDRFGFAPWVGRPLSGFGPFKPNVFLGGRRHALRVESDPAGADVRIDNAAYGRAPISAELDAGRHLVELRKAGFETHRRIVAVEKNDSYQARLAPRSQATAGDSKESFRIMTAPFGVASGEDPYGEVLRETLMANFGREKRLQLVAPPAGSQPGLASAAEAGADLLVTGSYTLRDERLLVRARLIDVKTERIKFADLYPAEGGLQVFQSIDSIAADFSRAVGRVLPEPGEPIVEDVRVVTSEMTGLERELFRRELIRRRGAHVGLLSSEFMVGGYLDRVQLQGATQNRSMARIDNTPAFGLRLGYDHALTSEWTLHASFIPWYRATGGRSDPYLSVDPKTHFDFSLLAGPRFVYRDLNLDAYLSPLVCLSVFPGTITVINLGDGGVRNEFGPYFFAGLAVDMGVRYFIMPKVSDPAWFLSLGLLIEVVQGRFDQRGSGPAASNLLGLMVGAGRGL